MKRISKAVPIVIALIGALSLTNALPKELQAYKQTSLMHKSGEFPKVQMLEYTKNPIGQHGWGSGFSFGIDIAGAYEIPVSHLYTNKDNILINPKVHLEASSHNYL